MKHYIYIVKCRDESLYTGYSLNIQKRVVEHNSSPKGAKSLRGKLPVTLVYSEEYNTKSQALRRELEIKTWTRERKLKLIAGIKLPAPNLSEL